MRKPYDVRVRERVSVFAFAALLLGLFVGLAFAAGGS